MFVTGRREGEWIEFTHRSGDVFRFKLRITRDHHGWVQIAVDDPARNFETDAAGRPSGGRKKKGART